MAVSVARIKALMDEKTDFTLIDARPERAFAAGTIPGAINISDSKFDKMTDRLPGDKEKVLVFFCGGLKCDLSTKSAEKARALGYRKVFVFVEGYPAWVAAHGGGPASGAAATTGTGGTPAGAMLGIEPGKEKAIWPLR